MTAAAPGFDARGDEQGALCADLRRSLLRIHRMMRRANEDKFLGMSEQSVMMALFREGGLAAGEIARRVCVQASTLTPIIARLVDGGLIRRDFDPGDRRQTVVQLTRTGARRMAEQECALDLWFTDRLERLTAAERDLLSRAVPVLALMVGQQ
jgi:DNA-binding MarR family transcriptional regulator